MPVSHAHRKLCSIFTAPDQPSGWRHQDVQRTSSPTRQTKTSAFTFWENGAWRTIELQLRSSDERGVKQMKSNKLRKREETPVALQFALAVGAVTPGCLLSAAK